jgi:hypothetical protein
MKKFFSLIALTFCISFAAKSQAAKSVYAEIGGPGLASLNFDTRFKGEKGIGVRAGIGGFSVEGGSILLFPVGFNYLIGKDDKNYFELGAGATIVSASNEVTGDQPYTGSFGHLTIGYRLQPKNGGFTFRAAITPIFGQGTFWPYWGGVSFGYKF